MMTNDYSKYDIGVIIGRFQVHELHEAHRTLIETVADRHKKVILFLGVSPVLGTTRNPLDFTARKKMIQEEYPDLVIVALPDQRSDQLWSRNLDSRVREVFPIGSVLLYGGRDSFIPHYFGGFDVTELEQNVFVSRTEIRKQASEEIKSSSLWRAGAIYQAYNRYPVSYQTVDIAALSSDKKRILLAKKPNETLYRFIGGFVDPKDTSLEHAAKREFMEEAGGAEIGNLLYVGSFRVDDWRYAGERDKIMTTLFRAKYTFGSLAPSDDISELKWVDYSEFSTKEFINTQVIEEHRPLALSLIASVQKEIDDDLFLQIIKKGELQAPLSLSLQNLLQLIMDKDTKMALLEELRKVFEEKQLLPHQFIVAYYRTSDDSLIGYHQSTWCNYTDDILEAKRYAAENPYPQLATIFKNLRHLLTEEITEEMFFGPIIKNVKESCWNGVSPEDVYVDAIYLAEGTPPQEFRMSLIDGEQFSND